VAAVRYLVGDLDAAVAFYVDRLGFSVREDWGPVVIVTRDDVELWLSGPGSSAAGYPLQSSRFVLAVPDLDATLAGLGLEPEIIDGAAGRWAAIEDPGGNLVELFEQP
jgi:catechol 2,3-dioxygenase-like lactoylglutathione lyase family enzyme